MNQRLGYLLLGILLIGVNYVQAKTYDLAWIKKHGLDKIRVSHKKPGVLQRLFGAQTMSPESFFELVGSVYLRMNFVRDPEALFYDQTETEYYQQRKDQQEVLFENYAQAILQANNPPVEIRWVSEKVGFGVFATHDIAEGDFVQVYTGQILFTEEMKKTGSDYSWNYPAKPDGNAMSLDAHFAGNEMRYVNHGDNPNIAMYNILVNNQWHSCYIAVRSIKQGEQLLVSYGSRYWNNRQHLYVDL